MSKYTTEVRYICETNANLKTSVGANSIDEIIDKSAEKIFNFSFPIFDESYRKVIEHKILKHYYTREIGEESVGLWKLRLNTKLNEIMPYYNKLYKSELIDFNPLYTTSMTRTHEKELDDTSNTISNNSFGSSSESNSSKINENTFDNTTTSNSNFNNNGNGTNTNANMQMYSDTPQGGLTGLESGTYLTNATKDSGSGTTNTHSDGTSNGTVTGSGKENTVISNNETSKTDNTAQGNEYTNENTTEKYLETVNGYDGKNTSEMILKYRETFLNIDMLIINDLDVLFMQLW